jgi:hypothetical protein
MTERNNDTSQESEIILLIRVRQRTKPRLKFRLTGDVSRLINETCLLKRSIAGFLAER